MSTSHTLKAVRRARAGKGAAREARRNGLVPAVIYGDKKPPVIISVKYFDVLKELHTGNFLSQVYDLEVDGEVIPVIPKDFQVDVVKDLPLHVDFMRLTKGAKLTVEISVNFINEDICPGLKAGGALNVVRHEVELACPSDKIPESLTVDLASVEIGDSIHVSDITLPEGSELTVTDRDFTIASIVGRAADTEADVEEAGGDEEAEAESRGDE